MLCSGEKNFSGAHAYLYIGISNAESWRLSAELAYRLLGLKQLSSTTTLKCYSCLMKPQPNPGSSGQVQQVGVRELRQDASGILRQVKAGECIEITEHGRPIARIVPIGPSLYEEAIISGLITAPTISSTEPMPKLIKATSGLNSTKVLLEMRAEERS